MTLSRNPRKPSAQRLRALERRVARLERQQAKPTPASVVPTYPGQFYGWLRCPLCGAIYTGVHACWTWNPRQPWMVTITTTGLPAFANGSTWANNEGSGGHLH